MSPGQTGIRDPQASEKKEEQVVWNEPQIRELVEREYACQVQEVTPVRENPFPGGAVYRLRTSLGTGCFKRHQVSVPPESLAQLPAAIQHLHEAGFTHTPRLFPSASGPALISCEEVWWSWTEWVEGAYPYPALSQPRSPALLQTTAQLLAHFHGASRGFGPWPQPPETEEWVRRWQEQAEKIRSHQVRLGQEPQRTPYQQKLWQEMEEYRREADCIAEEARTQQSLYQQLVAQCAATRGFMHGDFCLDNVLLIPGSSHQVLIDLDFWEPGLPWEKDLPNLVRAFALHPAEMQAVLTEYLTITGFSEAERVLLPIFLSPANVFSFALEYPVSPDYFRYFLQDAATQVQTIRHIGTHLRSEVHP